MDTTVFQTLYNSEWTEAYEQKQSYLRGTVQTKGDVNGNTFVFVLEGDADEAVTRGHNGNIPYAADDQSSTPCILAEYHHLARKNNFNIYSASVDNRLSMQRRGVISMNKKTDALILAAMSATTTEVSATDAPASLALLSTAVAILDENFIPRDGERYGLLTPRAWQQMMKVNQFSSGDWVSDQPFMKSTMWREWNSVKWTVHPGLVNVGLADAECYVYHKYAVGHALNRGNMVTKVGVQEEHDYSWARTSSYQGAKILRDAGVVRMLHDDSAAL